MKFTLIDAVIEQAPERIVAVKQVSLAEEYLGDHFPGFPVLPGVLMVEAMAQAARIMLGDRGGEGARLVLGEVRALKFGNMVRPGERLRVEVTLASANDDGTFSCKGSGTVERNGESAGTAVLGRFVMRPIANAPVR